MTENPALDRSDHAAGPSKPTNTLAVASLTSSLLWFGGLGSVAAIILGKKAQEEIRSTGQPGEGLASAGILIGWIGVVVTALGFLLVLSMLGSMTSSSLGGVPTFGQSEEARLNLGSALNQAANAERSYFATNNTYTADVGELTRGGLWGGVTLNVAYADDSTFCVEGRHEDLPNPRHVTESIDRPKKGDCPSRN